MDPAEIRWSHLPISREDLQAHGQCQSKGVSKIIATHELVAQLVLLKGRLANAPTALDMTSRRMSFKFRENSSVVAAAGRWLTTKAPSMAPLITGATHRCGCAGDAQGLGMSLLYVDDLLVDLRPPGSEAQALLVLAVLAIIGAQLSWRKFC